MPGVDDLHLERLGPEGTAEQVAALSGGAVPSAALAARVHARSGGNPYLTELLMRADPYGASEPGASVSEALREALLSRWHGLSGSAREVTRAARHRWASGGPGGSRQGDRPCGPWLGRWPRRCASRWPRRWLRVCSSAPSGSRVWFRHPLIAEVLTSEATAPDSAPVHSAYAEALADGPAPEPGDLASHHELAGQLEEAFRWSLVAADSAASAQGETERLEHLQRACRLWPQVMAGTEPVANYVQLLLRTVIGCLSVNRPRDGLDLLEQALSLTDRNESPAVACRLLTLKHRMLMEAEHLPFGTVTPPLREALALAESLPGTAEQVIVDVTVRLDPGVVWEPGRQGTCLSRLEDRAAAGLGRGPDPGPDHCGCGLAPFDAWVGLGHRGVRTRCRHRRRPGDGRRRRRDKQPT